jgi:predicted RNase H-like nuclease (RuvC/YqgF family)
LQRKLRDLNRRVEELTEDVKLLEETNLDLKSEKSRLNLQLEEMRTGLRTKLQQFNRDLSTP